MNMNLGDIIVFRKFIMDRRAAAEARKAKEQAQNNPMRNKYLNAAYRGHPQGGITGTKDDPNRFNAMTRDDYAKLEEDLEELT